MRIRMRETRRGSDDGVTVKDYLVGQEYELTGSPRAEDLAAVFVREKWADQVKPTAPEHASGDDDKRAAAQGKGTAAATARKG